MREYRATPHQNEYENALANAMGADSLPNNLTAGAFAFTCSSASA